MEPVRVKKVGAVTTAWSSSSPVPNASIAATIRELAIAMLSVFAAIITLVDTVSMNFVLMTAQATGSVIRKQ